MLFTPYSCPMSYLLTGIISPYTISPRLSPPSNNAKTFLRQCSLASTSSSSSTVFSPMHCRPQLISPRQPPTSSTSTPAFYVTCILSSSMNPLPIYIWWWHTTTYFSHNTSPSTFYLDCAMTTYYGDHVGDACRRASAQRQGSDDSLQM